MKRIFAVIELADSSTLDPSSDDHLDELLEDLLHVAHGVASVVVYTTLADLTADETP